MSSDIFPFKTEFQLGILKLMLSDVQFLEQCGYFLQSDYFDSLYLGWLFNCTVKFWKQFGKTPSVETIKNEISKFAADERLPYSMVLDKVISCEYNDGDYIRSELTRFVKFSITVKGLRNIIDMTNNGEYDKAIVAYEKASEKVIPVNFDKDDCIDFDNFDSILDKIRKDSGDKIRVGIPPIDKETNGGLMKGTLLVWLGVTNVGKSVILVNHAVNMMKQGKRVLFVDLEMDESVTLPRFIGCLTGIPLNRLTRSEEFLLPEERQKIREAKEFLKEHLKLKIVKDEVRYVENLSVFCRTLKSKWPFDALVCDYGMKLTTKDKFASRYERFGEVYDRLGRIGMTNDLVVVTAAQGNRDARRRTRHSQEQTSLVTMDDMADSVWISNVASYVFTLTKSEKDEANNKIKILMDKQRLGRTNICVEYTTDFSCCRAFGPNMQFEVFNAYQEKESKDE